MNPMPSTEWVQQASAGELSPHLIHMLNGADISTRWHMITTLADRAEKEGAIRQVELAMLDDPEILAGIGYLPLADRAQAKLAQAGR